MSVLLPTVQVAVWDPAVVNDSHGWAEETDPILVWTGLGNVQESAVARTDAGASEPGGSGPYDPVSLNAAVAYLPTDALAEPGMVLEAHAREWLVISTRFVPDPTGGGLDCLLVDLTERGGGTWPSSDG